MLLRTSTSNRESVIPSPVMLDAVAESVGIRGAGLARDEKQVARVMVGLQTHGGIVHVTKLLIRSTRASGSVC